MRILFIAAALIGLVLLVRLNVWYYRLRAKMTPEEREQEDDNSRIW